jgi:hypothetical protein
MQQAQNLRSHALQPSSCSPPTVLQLDPVQSCRIHGWMNPKRTLSWDDLCNGGSGGSKGLTLSRCLEEGLSAEDLRTLQPDVGMWVKHKGVSFEDVCSMTAWPLHPVHDLRGNISDLASMHYPASVLRDLGITYAYLRDDMHMDDEWMRMMRYTPAEWAVLGMKKQDVVDMGRQRVSDVFQMEYEGLHLAIAAAAGPTA